MSKTRIRGDMFEDFLPGEPKGKWAKKFKDEREENRRLREALSEKEMRISQLEISLLRIEEMVDEMFEMREK